MKGKSSLCNEEGSVLVIALIFLVLLTLLGISITTTSEIEIQISGNERRHKQNLYNAEGAAMEGAQILEETETLEPKDEDLGEWLIFAGQVSANDIRTDGWWGANGRGSEEVSHGRFVAIDEGAALGYGIGADKTQLHAYTIYGRRYNAARPNQGRSIVKVGYRKIIN
jgi:hypothetical protein